jgi:hypothetical protein
MTIPAEERGLTVCRMEAVCAGPPTVCAGSSLFSGLPKRFVAVSVVFSVQDTPFVQDLCRFRAGWRILVSLYLSVVYILLCRVCKIYSIK